MSAAQSLRASARARSAKRPIWGPRSALGLHPYFTWHPRGLIRGDGTQPSSSISSQSVIPWYQCSSKTFPSLHWSRTSAAEGLRVMQGLRVTGVLRAVPQGSFRGMARRTLAHAGRPCRRLQPSLGTADTPGPSTRSLLHPQPTCSGSGPLPKQILTCCNNILCALVIMSIATVADIEPESVERPRAGDASKMLL